MILLISDIHCHFELINLQIDYAEKELKVTVSTVIVLGDFGLFEPYLKRFFVRDHQIFNRPVFYIEGNHEDFSAFHKIEKKYQDKMTYLPRSTLHHIDSISFLALGGASYMDAFSTPLESVIKDDDIEQCLKFAGHSIDVVISHDCPNYLNVPNTPGFECYGKTGFAGGEKIRDHLQPRFWIFGHHHKWFEKKLDQTHYIGLAESWNGFVLFDQKDFPTIIKNHITLDNIKKKSYFFSSFMKKKSNY